MKRLVVFFLLMAAAAAPANVVRPAPNFSWEGTGRATSLRGVQGQAVVLLVAKNARVGALRAQVKKLKELYQEFSSRQVIFAAAFREGEGEVRSDIPFVIAKDGAKVAADYEVTGDFNLILIGKDGNVDMQTAKVCPAARVRDVMINSFVVQAAARK
jgi:hypothetical protein